MMTAAAVAEIDLGTCLAWRSPILAGEEYVSVIETNVDGTVVKVSNRHAAYPSRELEDMNA